MAFDLRSFALQTRPSPKRPNPEALNDSVFDAGSPQYVRPEDLFLDIQARLFKISPLSAKDLQGIDPADFRKRWLASAASALSLRRAGGVRNYQLVDSAMSMLRCPLRKSEHYPTLLPIVPSIGFYKNIKPNLPNFLNDQFRPALSFADEQGFAKRISAITSLLLNGTHADDSLKVLAAALLPQPSNTVLQSYSGHPAIHEGPLLKDYTLTPSKALPVCESFKDAIDSFIALEPLLPRILWIRWLTAALRLWLPLFFLKRCTISVAAAQAAKAALRGTLPRSPELAFQLFGSNAILRGSKEWLNQITPIVQSYVRARFELSILLDLTNLCEWLAAQNIDPTKPAHISRVKQQVARYEVDPRVPNGETFPPAMGVLSSSKKLSMPGDSGQERLPLDEWLRWVVANRQSLDALARIIGADDACDLVERVYAHIRPDYEPLKGGFGKNAYEYVSFVLGATKADRDPEIPDEFNLFFRGQRGRRSRQVQVQPGPQLLAILVQIVNHQQHAKYQSTAKLGDLLDLFDNLGLDYRSNPEDFETLKSDLLRLGLLQSSADAAEAASLKPTYSI